MGDKREPEARQTSSIQRTRSEGYHIASSLSRRGPLWPQTFGPQMDNKLCTSPSRQGLAGFLEESSNENGEDASRSGLNSDLTEPLLRSTNDNFFSSVRKTRSEDLSVEKEDRESLLTKSTVWTHVDADRADEGASDLQEEAVPSGSSFLQATLNGVNVLAGVGILSTPYALSQGGWLSMGFLFAFAVICFYTGLLLRRMLDTDPAVVTYPDVGQAAFGRKGRLVVSILLYFELYCVTVEYLILEGDNLASLFPFAGAVIGNARFTAEQVYVALSALCMLPTLLLRDLSLLSYISAGGVVASLAIVSTVGYIGEFEGVGFHHSGTLINIGGLPVAVGVYAFCFCGHAVFPSIYRSMKQRKDFSKVLFVCFAIVTIIYAGIGVLGYTMFGDEAESQVTLNLPSAFLSSRIAIWITLVNPFAKYALTMSPLAVALEEFLPWTPKSRQFFWFATGIRTMLVASTVLVAVAVPFFGYMMAFIGSFMSISVAIILPCMCYLRIFGRHRGILSGEYAIILIISLVGLLTACIGTYSALKGIVGNFGHLKLERH